jgi:hypothetical protein
MEIKMIDIKIKEIINEQSALIGAAWTNENIEIRKVYGSRITFQFSKIMNCIVLVEPPSDECPDNAVIFNLNGTIKLRLKNPLSEENYRTSFVWVNNSNDSEIELFVSSFDPILKRRKEIYIK